MNKSVKKGLIWTGVALFVVACFFLGGPFGVIDTVIVRPIVNILFVIFNLVGDFGIAIIIFTVLVKLLMIPLTRSQIRQTKLMRRMQPELVKIRKNCNGNKQLESLQTMDLYKRYNIKPFRSMITLLIQLPIFVAIYSSIRVIATPLPTDNLSNRAYEIVAYEGSEIKELEEKQAVYLADLTNDEIPDEEKAEYDFHPTLFGVVDLSARASDVFSASTFSVSAVVMLILAIAASLAQYFMAKMQNPSRKAEKSKSFRDLLKEAEGGRELDSTDINAMTQRQMSAMMPIMMFVIMINLHGALAFYYFLSNILTIIIQRILYARVRDDLDDATDAKMTRELKKIQEAEVVENKKTGTKITRISAKDNKKKRR